MCIINNANSGARDVESMATNLVIVDVLKIKIREENDNKTEYKNRKFDGICYHCGQKGHISRNCRAQKNVHYKKFEEAEKAIDGDEDELVLCSWTSYSRTKENKKKKVWFAEDVK